MVPKTIQSLVWKHYRPRQEIDKKPTPEYIAVAAKAIRAVAIEEGRQVPFKLERAAAYADQVPL